MMSTLADLHAQSTCGVIDLLAKGARMTSEQMKHQGLFDRCGKQHLQSDLSPGHGPAGIDPLTLIGLGSHQQHV